MSASGRQGWRGQVKLPTAASASGDTVLCSATPQCRQAVHEVPTAHSPPVSRPTAHLRESVAARAAG